MRITPRIKHKAASFIIASSLWACWIKLFAVPGLPQLFGEPHDTRYIFSSPIIYHLGNLGWTLYVFGGGALLIFAYRRVALWRRAFEREHGVDEDVVMGPDS
ncbi:MAG TPA: hypothetical protein VGX68_04155 [Thermoanaerobaculia bacterium]|nr:hypothetical protein [Thermoanaerobaculia bacterium]